MDLLPEGCSWDRCISKQILTFEDKNHCKYAIKLEESYCSKLDNEERRNAQQSGSEIQPNSQMVRYRRE